MGFLTESKSESVFDEGLKVFQGFGSDQEIDREGLVFGFCVKRPGASGSKMVKIIGV